MKRAADDDPLFKKLVHFSENAESIQLQEATAFIDKHWKPSPYQEPKDTRDLHEWFASRLEEVAKVGDTKMVLEIFTGDTAVNNKRINLHTRPYVIDSWDKFHLWHSKISNLVHSADFNQLSSVVHSKALMMWETRLQEEVDRVLEIICLEWNRVHPRIRAMVAGGSSAYWQGVKFSWNE